MGPPHIWALALHRVSDVGLRWMLNFIKSAQKVVLSSSFTWVL